MSLRTPTARAAVAAGAAAVAVLASALPGAAHPSFPSSGSATPAFAPNVLGGFGVGVTAPAYGPDTEYELAFRLPDEVDAAHDGKDDNNVKAVVTVPAGWTGATCGDARTNKNDASTNFTNQPGAVVAGWSCALTTETITGFGPRQVLTWTGPQADTVAASAQFFMFKVKTPAVTTVTRYGSAPDTATPATFATGEGFVAQQVYASYDAQAGTGQIRNWYPPSHPAQTSANVASGLIRTVGTAAPGNVNGNQTLSAVVPGAPGGSFSMSIPGNAPVALTKGTSTNDFHPFTGSLRPVTVIDSRAAGSTWTLSGQVTNFIHQPTGSTLPDSTKFLAWTPAVSVPGAGAAAGPRLFTAFDALTGGGFGTGFSGAPAAKTLGSGSSGQSPAEGSVGAALSLKLPTGLPGGAYGTTMTLTLF